MALLGIDDTLHELLQCVSQALADDEAPVCSVGGTLGQPAIASCCDCGDGEGELWGNLVRVYRSQQAGLADAPPQKPCLPAHWSAEYRITLARCFPVIDESGELPSVEARTEATARGHADVATVHRAIHCCGETEPPYLVGIQVETDPAGGCSFLVATVRVPVSLHKRQNLRA